MEVGIRQAVKEGMIKCKVPGVADFSYPTSKLRRGRVQGGGEISPTITTTSGVCRIMSKEQIEKTGIEESIYDYLYKDFGIFKLTARECLRLQGVGDPDIDKMEKINSKTQLLKQAGNSISVPVLMAIFSQLHIKGVPVWNELTDEEKDKWVKDTIPVINN